jgi:hypothetical protein
MNAFRLAKQYPARSLDRLVQVGEKTKQERRGNFPRPNRIPIKPYFYKNGSCSFMVFSPGKTAFTITAGRSLPPARFLPALSRINHTPLIPHSAH